METLAGRRAPKMQDWDAARGAAQKDFTVV